MGQKMELWRHPGVSRWPPNRHGPILADMRAPHAHMIVGNSENAHNRVTTLVLTAADEPPKEYSRDIAQVLLDYRANIRMKIRRM